MGDVNIYIYIYIYNCHIYISVYACRGIYVRVQTNI